MKPLNPFLTTGYISPEYFCDREKESKEIISALMNGRNLTLFSLRRMGKTGLIENVFHNIRKNKDISLFYMDILSTNNLNDFLNILGKAFLNSMNSKTTVLFQKIGDFLSKIRPVINYDNITGQPSMQFNFQNVKDAEYTLESIFDYLNKMDKRIFIAIDEFQQIVNYPEKNIEALLRTNIQKSKNLNFIFSGSQKHLLMSIFGEYKKPFYQSTQLMHLEKIKNDFYKKFIKDKFNSNKKTIDDESIDFILGWTRGHTFYTQYFCNRLFGYSSDKINMDLVLKIKDQILTENEYLYYNYKNLLTEYQWNLLKAIAKEDTVKTINSKEFIKKYKLNTPSSIQSALKPLLNKELISSENNEYMVYDVFMSRWLKEK